MTQTECCRHAYKAPLWLELVFVPMSMLSSLSLEGGFDESGFSAEPESSSGWGDERGVN